MNSAILLVLIQLLGQTVPDQEPAHRRNRVFVDLLRSSPKFGGPEISLPAPILRDGMDGNAQQAALLNAAGSEQSRDALLRDSVTAPYVLKVHDTPTNDAILRRIDLWFVVRGDLDRLEPLAIAGQNTGKPVEVGNMRFESRILSRDELKAKELSTAGEKELSEWFVLVKGRLLGKTSIEAVDEVICSRSEESMVIASRTAQAFDASGPISNRWHGISPDGQAGLDQPYPGGGCYAKISKLKGVAGALLIEVHCIFNEPRGWFQGEPILRSKFALVAQDQIRRLRRELSTNRSRTNP